MWITIYGVPCRAWDGDFFVSLANSLGNFVCLEKNTSKGTIMDIVRVFIRVPLSFTFYESMSMDIDGKAFSILLREDSFDPVRVDSGLQKKYGSVLASSDSEEGWFTGSSAWKSEDDGEGLGGDMKDFPLNVVDTNIRSRSNPKAIDSYNCDKDDCHNSTQGSGVAVIGNFDEALVSIKGRRSFRSFSRGSSFGSLNT